MNFEFATASKIIFGKGTSGRLSEFIKGAGTHPLVVLGTQKIGEVFVDGLSGLAGVEKISIDGEPTLPVLTEALEFARSKKCDFVIGIGGGSVIDSGKAISCLLNNPGEILDYLEVVGKNQPLQNRGVPYFALPTTAGTGAEVTRNAVINVPEKRQKASMRSPYMYPTAAIVDPFLTYNLPPAVTATTGMDALTQVLEPYVSIKANGLVDLFCREGLQRIGRSLVKVYRDGSFEAGREDMCWGSLLGGLSLANAGLGAVHGFAAPIGGMFQAPHGAICARLLAPVTAMNIKVMQEREPGHPSLLRYLEAGRLLFGPQINSYNELVTGLEEMTANLEIKSLKDYGIRLQDVSDIAEKAAGASSMKGNPVKLEIKELEEILRSVL
ncbi:MAG: iron-containing alcohol dehydrogenase [Anaerolineae bacterium]|nr:iron-containing alcohol dehydrogenase [Anaerolineae bacterium]